MCKTPTPAQKATSAKQQTCATLPPSKTMLDKTKMGIWNTSAGNHSVFSDGCVVSLMARVVA
jgi:hypothetical protein